jgi:nucleotide-binding universal stress UspA family protein
MHVIVATDGSQASLEGARQFKLIADSREIRDVTELGPQHPHAQTELSYRKDAAVAVDVVAAVFDGWGPRIHRDVRSGSPATEIVRAAEDLPADLIAMAAGSRGLTATILLGSTASRVQHSAPCPVLICRPTRPRRS